MFLQVIRVQRQLRAGGGHVLQLLREITGFFTMAEKLLEDPGVPQIAATTNANM